MNSLDAYGSLDLDLVPINNSMSRVSHLRLSDSHSPTRLETPSNDGYGSSSPVRDLANLNVAVHECATNLPSMPEAGLYPKPPIIDKQSTRKVALFAIDELFRLTSEFVDALKRLASVESDTGAAFASSSVETTRTQPSLPLLTHTQPSPAGQPVARTGSSLHSGPFSHVDEATMLLVMSCHCRLIDTHTSVFRMMQACIEYSIRPQMDKEAVIVLPRLQIGSHTAPAVQVDASTAVSPATSSMYMLMMTMFSTKLCEQMAEVMRTGQGKGGEREEGLPESALLEPQQAMWDTMKGQTDRLSRDIDVTRRMLQRLPVATE